MKGEYQLVRNCISGHVFDSSPVDFTSDLGTRHALPTTIQKMPGSSKLVSWVAKGIASGLDALYLTRFESQRTEYWQALYSSVVSYVFCTLVVYPPKIVGFLFTLSDVQSFFPSFPFCRIWEHHFSFLALIKMILLPSKACAILLVVYKNLGEMLSL